MFRYLAWEMCIQSQKISSSSYFFDQSDEKIIATFATTFLKHILEPDQPHQAPKFDRVVICIDGISKLRDTIRFKPGIWLLRLLR